MPNSKQIVYLSQSQYIELITNGTITVDGVTVTYDENDIYVTPQAEPVTDVRVAGTSIAANGIANILPVKGNTAGVVRIGATNGWYGIKTLNNEGVIGIQTAEDNLIKAGVNRYKPVTPLNQEQAAFYGLAKIAGHDEASSTESVGTYTPEAKGAIQSMLGVSGLIATAENSLVASKAYAIGDVFTANGKLYKATAAIAANDSIVLQNEGESVSGYNAEECNISNRFVKFSDFANNGKPGIIQTNPYYGTVMINNNTLAINEPGDERIKNADRPNVAITTSKQHAATFYGLAKAAGDTTQSQSDNAVGTYTDNAKSAIRTMLGAVGDIQINSTSIVNDGVASIPVASSSTAGVVKIGGANMGVAISAQELYVNNASDSEIKNGNSARKPINADKQHMSTFYGLAKAAGDTTQSASSNAVGTYTDNAKASIKSMLGIVDGSTGTVDVSGAAPTIAAVENTRYVCGEVTSLDFTPAASGVCIVRFTSGSTPTLLTLPSTVKFPEWFDSTALETDTIYEMCITDGVYGAVMSWAL